MTDNVSCDQVGARNSHLVKLYAVSLVQLMMVLGVVVLFTEIKEVTKMTLGQKFQNCPQLTASKYLKAPSTKFQHCGNVKYIWKITPRQ